MRCSSFWSSLEAHMKFHAVSACHGEGFTTLLDKTSSEDIEANPPETLSTIFKLPFTVSFKIHVFPACCRSGLWSLGRNSLRCHFMDKKSRYRTVTLNVICLPTNCLLCTTLYSWTQNSNIFEDFQQPQVGPNPPSSLNLPAPSRHFSALGRPRHCRRLRPPKAWLFQRPSLLAPWKVTSLTPNFWRSQVPGHRFFEGFVQLLHDELLANGQAPGIRPFLIQTLGWTDTDTSLHQQMDLANSAAGKLTWHPASNWSMFKHLWFSSFQFFHNFWPQPSDLYSLAYCYVGNWIFP